MVNSIIKRQLIVVALVAIFCSVSFGRAPPSGLAAVDVSVDDANDWSMVIGPESPWGSRVETGDKLIAWGERRRDFTLRWNSNINELSDFLCDNVDDKIYLFIENHRDGKGLEVKVPVTDPNGFCP